MPIMPAFGFSSNIAKPHALSNNLTQYRWSEYAHRWPLMLKPLYRKWMGIQSRVLSLSVLIGTGNHLHIERNRNVSLPNLPLVLQGQDSSAGKELKLLG